MPLNLEQLKFEHLIILSLKTARDVYTMRCEDKNLASEVKHTESECGSLSIILDIIVQLTLYQHLINMYCVLSCMDLNCHTTLFAN